MVPMPKAVQDFLAIFEVFNFNIGGISLPLQCVGLGSFSQQMLFTIVFPLAIAAGIALCAIIYARCSSKARGKALPQANNLLVPKQTICSACGRTSSLQIGLLLALPHLLTLTFLVMPMASVAQCN